MRIRSCRRRLLFPETEVVKGFNDISPRFGAAYDLRGDGKTSVKVSLGRYLAAVNADGIYASTAPVALIGGGGARTAPTTTRHWTDLDKDYVPDCNLNNKATNGECGAWGTQNFGEPLTSAVDPRLTGHEGSWYRRPYDWGFGVSVQHELRPRLSVDVSYNRRWWGNDTVVDNLAVGPVDYDDYSVKAPADPRTAGRRRVHDSRPLGRHRGQVRRHQQLRSAVRQTSGTTSGTFMPWTSTSEGRCAV